MAEPTHAPHDAEAVRAGRENTAKNSLTVVVWTLLSRVAGLLRVLVIGALMGPTHFADIFQAGYVLPNTIHSTIAGPILAMVLIPTIVRALDHVGVDRAKEVLSRMGGRILGVAATGAGTLMLLSPLVAWSFTAGIPEPLRHRAWILTIILILFVAPQVVLYGACALGVAAQQANGRFGLAAAAPAAENVGTIITVLLTCWIYGTGLEVDNAPIGMMIMLGAGTTISVLFHLALQMYGVHKVGLLTMPGRGWKQDPEARDGVRRVLRSIPVAACPSVTNYTLTAIAVTAGGGGVWVVQLAYQVYYALSFLGTRAVSMAALPRLAEASASGDTRRFGIAWRQGLFFAMLAGLPALCLLAAFASPTANLLANGELREANLIAELAGCLAVTAFAQLAGGIHDFGRQALFSRLDDHGPRIASFIGLFVGIVVAFSTLLLPPDGTRLAGLLVAVLAGEAASAITVMVRVRASIRPEAFTTSRHLLTLGLATVSMLPVIAVGHWLLRLLDPERLMEMVLLLGCGAVTLGVFFVVVRYIGLKVTAEQV
ncbi:murein biosynthesis integral membrane protein MurJ [Pseudonocardia spinosispora]|uniref:murein biosynthesis integral membrane protein MurJ n=1 Tax=Pseudonocardia spinosispora TaxID=103441 RepID=UPI00040CD746|nr:lipid II flippase MurJ [Pseudonocardia spinosispora]